MNLTVDEGGGLFVSCIFLFVFLEISTNFVPLDRRPDYEEISFGTGRVISPSLNGVLSYDLDPLSRFNMFPFLLP